MTNPTPATPITAELKEAWENTTKGEWTYSPSPGGNSASTIYAPGKLVAAEMDDGDGRFTALAHNLLPSLIAAAEEAGRLRAERDSAFAAGRKEGLEKAAWRINKMIAQGPIGEPAHSERNGLVLAYNCVAECLALLDAPSEEPAGESAVGESGEMKAAPSGNTETEND